MSSYHRNNRCEDRATFSVTKMVSDDLPERVEIRRAGGDCRPNDRDDHVISYKVPDARCRRYRSSSLSSTESDRSWSSMSPATSPVPSPPPLDGDVSSEDDVRNENFLMSPAFALCRLANEFDKNVLSEDFAVTMDFVDPLRGFREKFVIPKLKSLPDSDPELVDLEEDCVYLCGNSLGLMPASAELYMTKTMQAWGEWAVNSHFYGKIPAASCDEIGREATARIVGAKENEVALCNGLTVNLHLLMVHFYRPTSQRYKILIEDHAFCSDRYAIRSQLEFHGIDPIDALIALQPRKGEHTLRTEDIVDTIEREGASIALVLFSGVQYYTGQKFDMEAITKAGHQEGCIVGFDLAHAVGNVRLSLHEWGIDFGCWCSYKYLNSGAGGIGGLFVHEKHAHRKEPKFQGWWGNKSNTRFEMREHIDLAEGVDGFRISNPPPFLACLNLASLEIFEEATMDKIAAKQFLLTGYLEMLLKFYLSGDHTYQNLILQCVHDIKPKTDDKDETPETKCPFEEKARQKMKEKRMQSRRFRTTSCPASANGYEQEPKTDLVSAKQVWKTSTEDLGGWLRSLQDEDTIPHYAYSIDDLLKYGKSKEHDSCAWAQSSENPTGAQFVPPADLDITVEVITPGDPRQRGNQLSLCVSNVDLRTVHLEIEKRGVLCDIRPPHVMRIAPTPLYNSFYDVWRFVQILDDALKAIKFGASSH